MISANNDFQRRLDFSKTKNTADKNKRRLVVALLFFGSAFTSLSLWLKPSIKDLKKIFFKPAIYHVVKTDQSLLEEALGFKPDLKTSLDLEKSINLLTQDLMGTYGLYLYNLNSNEEYGFNENKVYTAASVNKIPIMVSFYEQVEKGNLKEDDVYLLAAKDIRNYGTGQMRYQKLGTKYLLSDLIELSGKNSDNTAAYVLEKLIGSSYIQSQLNALGMKDTSIEDNTTTPKEMGNYFKLLYEDKLINSNNKEKIYKSLTKTDFEQRIPKYLPSNIKIVHKIGNEVQTSNDCGIVFGPKPYVLCILTKGVKESEALEVIPKLSLLVWEYIRKN